MGTKREEIIEELQAVISGKTLDAVFPPLIFVLTNHSLGLNRAVMISLGSAVILAMIRLFRGQTWKYALGGSVGVAMASGLAYLTRSATNYFLGSVLSSGLLFLITLVSLFINKPIAAWVSHLSRGWPLEWYWRPDIKPAYSEVTWLWMFFILMRLIIQMILFQRGDVTTLAWANILLGWPVTILVLVLSYIYGIWRLHQLGGPGVEEYREEKNPPWKGQTRGF